MLKLLENEWQNEYLVRFFEFNKFRLTPAGIIATVCVSDCAFSNQKKTRMSNCGMTIEWTQLPCNENFSINMIPLVPINAWNWHWVSSNPAVTMQDIINHPEYPWDYFYVSLNPNLNFTFILKSPNIMNHPEYPWDFTCGVSNNPNLTINLINKYPNDRWDFYNVSCNPGITMQDIINHPEYPWDWEESICDNPNLTIQFIKQFPSKEWNWSLISSNPNITMQDIIKNPEYPWSWDNIFTNKFILDKQLYVNNQIGRVLLLSMLDDYDNNTCSPLENNLTLLVIYNDYHLACILNYI